MTLDEYRRAWRAQDDPDRERPSDEELLVRVKERSEAFDRKIHRRDLLETLAAVLVAGLFGYEAVTSASWLSRFGAGIIVFASGFVVWWLRRARSAGPAKVADRSVADRLRAERERVEIQIRLLENVVWWYLGPPAVGATLFVVGLGAGTAATFTSLAVVAGVFGAVWYANRRAVRGDLHPRRDELTRLLADLEGHEPEER